MDSKNSPHRSYAKAVTANHFEASDPEQEDEEMTEVRSSDDSNMTPKKDNAKSLSSITKKNIVILSQKFSEKKWPKQLNRMQIRRPRARLVFSLAQPRQLWNELERPKSYCKQPQVSCRKKGLIYLILLSKIIRINPKNLKKTLKIQRNLQPRIVKILLKRA